MRLLQADSICLGYGKMEIIHGVSFDVEQGQIVGIIGNNGVGKSTILKAISGLIKVRSGKIVLNDKEINDVPPHSIVELGISFVPEGRRLFPYMSVQDNLKFGAYNNRAWGKREVNLKAVYEVFPSLHKARNRQAITLSGGEQQMLAVGRGMMSEPELLMLDEISIGLAPFLVAELFKIIERAKERGVTVLAAEQNVAKLLSVANKAYVVENGRIVMQGSGKELLNNPEMKNAYLRI
jgi:branched-chain amino acid transport system ATP-binding protein